LLRASAERFPDKVLLKIDGVGAFDHIYRATMLEKMASMPEGRKLLPFVLMSYGSASTYLWRDDQGQVHDVQQAEGGEQGDPLMPALFCLGIKLHGYSSSSVELLVLITFYAPPPLTK
jgi:hypothetical protein